MTSAQIISGAHSPQVNERLLNVLAEQIKMPLLQIARQAELCRLTNDTQNILDCIELTADSTLQLIDNYLMSTELMRARAQLKLEPVSVSAVLHDTAHQLSKLAKQRGWELELHMAGKYEPVMAHREGLEAALTSLGYVFIEAETLELNAKPVLKLAAHRSRLGIVTGMFANNTDNLGAETYRRARGLYGIARQPLNALASSSGAGVFVAESLLSSMSAKLRIARHQKLTGLAATLMPSEQMVLV